MNDWQVIQYRSDHHGGYALLEDSNGTRIWRFRDRGQYGYSDNRGAVIELGHTRDYPYELFESMIDLMAHIHELSKHWVLLTHDEHIERNKLNMKAFVKRGLTLVKRDSSA